MHSGKRLTLKDYFANLTIQLFLDNMVLANQNAKLTGPDQGFSSLPSSSYESPGNAVDFEKNANDFVNYLVVV
jgi:hypothetical protein